jgi:transposase InsO family protein
MCQALEVTRSGFFAWVKRPESPRSRRERQLKAKIRFEHEQSRGVYGSPRVHQALLIGGESVSRNTVAKLMRQEEIRAKNKRRFVPRTTDSRHDQPVAQNLLDRDFTASEPNRKWVADITYIPTGEGWLYVSAVLDCFSRKIIGYAMSERMETDLVASALQAALEQRRYDGELLHHSDRGVQYASDAYQHLLKSHDLTVSMSGRGDCYDNAMMESFWATLKKELIHLQDYPTRAAARQAIFEYIEVVLQS